MIIEMSFFQSLQNLLRSSPQGGGESSQYESSEIKISLSQLIDGKYLLSIIGGYDSTVKSKKRLFCATIYNQFLLSFRSIPVVILEITMTLSALAYPINLNNCRLIDHV